MLSIKEQIEAGKLVCPETHQPLHYEGSQVITEDGQRRYPLINGVPVLLGDEKQKTYLDEEAGSMVQTYESMQQAKPPWRAMLMYRIDRFAERGGDYRSQKSHDAFVNMAAQQGPDDVFLSVGGGPLRVHPAITNLNIGLFQNVDVVGDAYALPYPADSVSAVHCEAVLEHLEFPNEAAAEMFRVLQPEGQLLAVTPFLQAFHAFPNHFQNFTLIGHQRLFERAGFEVISSGVCVGPTYTIVDMLTWYCMYLPTRFLGLVMPRIVKLFGALIRPADRRLNNRNPSAHIMASTTYVHAYKPLTP